MNNYSISIEWTDNGFKLLSHNVKNGCFLCNGLLCLPDVKKVDLIAEIKRLGNKIKTNGKNVFLLPRNQMIVRFFDLPSVDRDEIERMVPLQITQHLPFAPDEMYYDYFLCNAERAGYSKVGLFAISKSRANEYLHIADEAGITPDILTVSSCAILDAALSFKGNDFFKGKHTIIVDTDSGKTELIILSGSSMIATRVFSHDAFLEGALKEQFIDRLISQIQHLIETQKQVNTGLTIDSLLLSDNLDVFLESLKEAFPHVKNIEVPDITSKYTMTGKIDKADSIMAHCGIFSGEGINLLPDDLKKTSLLKQTTRERKKMYISVIVFVMVLLSIFFYQFAKKYFYVKAIEQKLAQTNVEAKRAANIFRSINIIDNFKQEQVVPLEVITRLYKLVPEQILLSSFDYDANTGVEIKGIAGTMSQVSDFLLVLQKTDIFKAAQIKYAKNKKIKDAERVAFEIKCNDVLKREGEGL